MSALRGEAEASMGVFECSGLARVRFPSTLKRIGALVFSNCQKLKRITLPNGL